MSPPARSSSDTSAEANAERSAPILSEVQQRVVDALREDGIAVLPFRDLLGDDLWRAAAADIEGFVREADEKARAAGDRPAGKEEVIVRRFFDKEKKTGPPTFSFRDPWLRMAASDILLDVVNAYSGRWTKLFYVDNWYTIPFPKAEERIGSQRWHRDPEDPHVVKVFAYFSGVDAEAGPFEYVRGSPAGGRNGELWPWGGGERHPKADLLEAAVAPEDRLTVTGPAGTMFICDTGGLHRGGFARSKARVLSIATYLPPTAAKAGKRRYEVEGDVRSADVSPQARFALD